MRALKFATSFLFVTHCFNACAQDQSLPSSGQDVTFELGFGVSQFKAHEIVYDKSRILSRLNWQSSFVPTLNADIKVPFESNFYLLLSGSVASGGNGHMSDYDWLSPSPEWTDRSLHPDTRLDHYFSGSLEMGKSLLSSDMTVFSMGAGFQYTDIKWTARGGSYLYTFNDFRDTSGVIDPDLKAISFRKRWPVPYIAANIEHENDNWRISSGLRAGVTVNASGTDDHRQTQYRFRDDYFSAPTLSASLAGEYKLRDDVSLFMKGSAERMFRSRADVTETSLATGKQNHEENTTGGDFQTLSIMFGLNGRF